MQTFSEFFRSDVKRRANSILDRERQPRLPLEL